MLFVHGGKEKLTCAKCHFTTRFRFNLQRHVARIHSRGRSSFIPRRQIPLKLRLAAKKFLQENPETPEREQIVEKRFRLSPNTQKRLLRDVTFKATKAKRKLQFRDEGAGRKIDEWWAKIEFILLQRFEQQRLAGAIVTRPHMVGMVLDISAELGINLLELQEQRGWRDLSENIRQRVSKFLVKNKIKKKRASRQVYRDPKVKKNTTFS